MINNIGIFNALELEAQKGDHGGLKRYAHPKMRNFVLKKNKFNGELFLDLKKSVLHLEKIFKTLKEIHQSNKKILFVGTSNSTRNMLGKYIENTGHFFIDNKWSGGLLTNFRTLQKRVFKLQNMYNQIDKGLIDGLTKKEKIDFQEEQKKLEKNLKGIMEMKDLPDYIFIIDPYYHKIACQEAQKLNIPMLAMLKTNFNPDLFTEFVPINTDSSFLLEKIIKEMVYFCFDKSKSVVENDHFSGKINLRSTMISDHYSKPKNQKNN